MPTWILYALISMVFVGLTSIVVKGGLSNVPADIALTVHTSAVFGFIWLNALVGGQLRLLSRLTKLDLLVLAASGLTTALLPRHPAWRGGASGRDRQGQRSNYHRAGLAAARRAAHPALGTGRSAGGDRPACAGAAVTRRCNYWRLAGVTSAERPVFWGRLYAPFTVILLR